MKRKDFIKSLAVLPFASKIISGASPSPSDSESYPEKIKNGKIYKSTYLGQIYHPGQTSRALLEILDGCSEAENSLEHIAVFGTSRSVSIKYVQMFSLPKIKDPSVYLGSIIRTAKKQNIVGLIVCRHYQGNRPIVPDQVDFDFVKKLIRKGRQNGVYIIDYLLMLRVVNYRSVNLHVLDKYERNNYVDDQFDTGLMWLSFSRSQKNIKEFDELARNYPGEKYYDIFSPGPTSHGSKSEIRRMELIKEYKGV